MQDKHLLRLFLGLNVALAACFVVYLILSSNNQPAFVTTSFQIPTPTTNVIVKVVPAEVVPAITNAPTNAVVAEVATTVTSTNVEASKPVFVDKRINWEQLQADEQSGTNVYKTYLESLRAVGCPEEKIRYIVMADINELFSKKRLKEAVAHDMKWWRSESDYATTSAMPEKGRSLEEERRVLITKYLGEDAAQKEQGEGMLWSNVQLTGPVLGNLPPEVHNAVQEISARSRERSGSLDWAKFNDGQAPNAVEMAKLREQTRAELRRVLNAEGMEEFLLRYSQNATLLREELRGLDATPDEFRKILRGVDPIDHQMQLEYGTLDALSPQQRERHLALRDAAIRDALGPKRYLDYLVLKDPLYVKARQTATQFGGTAKAIMPIYQLLKANDARQQQILGDTSLSREAKDEAQRELRSEQITTIQRIISETRAP
jgi:hypothetical protein